MGSEDTINNPKGIASFGPALARFQRDPGYAHFSSTNLEGVEYQRLTKWMQLSRSCDFAPISPRVGLMEQQRAGPERWGAMFAGCSRLNIGYGCGVFGEGAEHRTRGRARYPRI